MRRVKRKVVVNEYRKFDARFHLGTINGKVVESVIEVLIDSKWIKLLDYKVYRIPAKSGLDKLKKSISKITGWTHAIEFDWLLPRQEVVLRGDKLLKEVTSYIAELKQCHIEAQAAIGRGEKHFLEEVERLDKIEAEKGDTL